MHQWPECMHWCGQCNAVQTTPTMSHRIGVPRPAGVHTPGTRVPGYPGTGYACAYPRVQTRVRTPQSQSQKAGNR
eukprot:312157-Rhodomonas_salina.1